MHTHGCMNVYTHAHMEKHICLSPTQIDNPELRDLSSVLKFRQLKLTSVSGWSLSALGRLATCPGSGNPLTMLLISPVASDPTLPDPVDLEWTALVLGLCLLPWWLIAT